MRVPSSVPGRLAAEECRACLTKLMKGIGQIEQRDERYSIMVGLSRETARQARALPVRPGISQPALLAEVVMRAHVLAKTWKTKAA